ncbi:hypothetical protein GBA52_010220 [Prunus armeniaca]|nr:hypothetical protein GBA52_010220 [Prunus armeniaca]
MQNNNKDKMDHNEIYIPMHDDVVGYSYLLKHVQAAVSLNLDAANKVGIIPMVRLRLAHDVKM